MSKWEADEFGDSVYYREMYELLEDVAWYLEQIADDDDESSKYASRIQELLARIDGEDEND